MSISIFSKITQPPFDYVMLNKLGYGPNEYSLKRIKELGLKGYLEEQVNPIDSADDVFNKKIQQLTYPINYEQYGAGGSKKNIKENRPYTLINASLQELWPLYQDSVPYAEKIYPAKQVFGATILRGVYSKWQLRELLVDFWHNHFNVSINIDDRVAVTFPIYDREVIRKNALGNFRQMLEAVAKSVSMQVYLDNASSKASPANENYARELFELHTLGAEHYLNHLYNRWREVPGATTGMPEGYIDEDVYEAARAFTGWTIADGADDWKGGRFPNNGEFYYFEQWHDNYQKRILGVEFSPNQPPLADGKKVLDILAAHPGTAKFICRKLCTRLISDTPSEQLIEKAAREWMLYVNKPDQIAHVVQFIALSEECKLTWGKKLKRPLELVISACRAVNAEITPNDNLMWSLLQMGQQPFAWPTPTGYPDHSEYWINSEMLLRRWNFPINMLNHGWHNYAYHEVGDQTPESLKTYREITEFWMKKILGYLPDAEIVQSMAIHLADGGKPDNENRLRGPFRKEKIAWLITGILLLPDFQVR
jgi:uncharacterized protein (DUF1800 family)